MEPLEKIKYFNSNASYFILQGALVIGKSEKGNSIIRANEMFIVPRNTEHSLVPADNKPVKIIVHQSAK